MSTRKVFKIFVVLVLIAAAFFSGVFIQKNWDKNKRISYTENGLSDGNDIKAADPVRIVPGTTKEMLSPGFWKSKSRNEILFTKEEIEDIQKNNPLSVLYYDKIEGRNLRLFMYDLPDTLPGRAVLAAINPDFAKDYASKETIYINQKKTISSGDGYWKALTDNCAVETIAEEIRPVYCICVKRDMLMLLPTDDFAASDPDEIYCNDFVCAEIMPFTGAVILHESRDGKWVFVLNGSYCGWVKKEALAVCEGKEEWLSFCKPDSFLVVTGCEIVLDETAVPTASAGMVLPMGTKIRLSDSDEGLYERKSFGAYIAEIPVRDGMGRLKSEKVHIPVSKDVSFGFLTMTSDAVIDLAFKFLGKVYGWGGSFSSNDCSGIARQVYACFGFELPRNSYSIASIFDLGGRNCKNASTGKKLEILGKMPAGTLLYMDGHLMIFLGMADEKPYVISSCASFIAPGDKSGTIIHSYGVFVSGMDLLRKDGKTWLESMTFFQWKEY